MKEIMQELERKSKERVSQLKRAKKSGTPVIQYTGNFIPEEMIRAAGAETYLMCRGGEPEPPDAVLDNMLRFMNPLARSMVGFYELGLDPVTPISDLIVAQQTDNHVGRISELFEYKKVALCKVGVPPDWTKDIAFDYYVESLKKMVAMIEETCGQKVDMDKARKNFEETNKLNACLSKIDELRKKDNPPIGLTQFILLQHYSFNIPAAEMIKALEALYDKLKDAPGIFKADAPRVLLAGHALAMGDYTVPRLVEESGAAIVCDFLDEGVRWFKDDLKIKDDPLADFARSRYLDKVPIDIFQPGWKERFEYMKQLIKDYKADGVIWYQLSFDEIYDMECTCLAKWFGDMNMPLLKMESSYEYSRESMGPLTTRIESFVESLKGGK